MAITLYEERVCSRWRDGRLGLMSGGKCRQHPMYNCEVPRIIVHLASVNDCRLGKEVSSVNNLDVNTNNCQQY